MLYVYVYIYAHDNFHFYEVACPSLGGLDVYDVSARISVWHIPVGYDWICYKLVTKWYQS
jgi:hypothetical protein